MLIITVNTYIVRRPEDAPIWSQVHVYCLVEACMIGVAGKEPLFGGVRFIGRI